MNFLSTQWCTDGSTSSEPMGLCITSIVKTLTDNHTLDDQNHQGHHNVAAVRDSVVHSPSKSVRRRSQELGINRESMRRILIADLHMYPCRIPIKQAYAWRHEEVSDHVPVVLWQDWHCARLVTGVTRSGCRIHQTWTPQIFICGDTLRTGCMATTPRLSLTWRQQSQQQ